MNSDSKIHFWYIVGILIALLVLVVTDRWTDKANFTVFLSNAATLTSLVLGVIAIFYSVVSNVDLAKSLGNIARVSDEIVSTKLTMGDFVRESKDLVASGEKNVDELRAASDAVTRDLSVLQETLSSLRAENQQLRESIVPIPARIDELAARFAESVPPVPPAGKPLPQSGRVEEKDKYLRRSSLIGIATSLGLAEAHRTGRQFDCAAVGQALEADAKYVHGYTVAIHALGGVTNKPEKGKIYVLDVSSAEPLISDITLPLVKEEVLRRKVANEDKWLQRLDAMVELFSTVEE